ncbi:hypothetical protein AOLI_G00021760 [Acnodon oligacanthus]
MDQCRQLMEMQTDSGWAVVGVQPWGSLGALQVGNIFILQSSEELIRRFWIQTHSSQGEEAGRSALYSKFHQLEPAGSQAAAMEMPHAIRPGLNELWISTKASKLSATGWRRLCGHWALRQ